MRAQILVLFFFLVFVTSLFRKHATALQTASSFVNYLSFRNANRMFFTVEWQTKKKKNKNKTRLKCNWLKGEWNCNELPPGNIISISFNRTQKNRARHEVGRRKHLLILNHFYYYKANDISVKAKSKLFDFYIDI